MARISRVAIKQEPEHYTLSLRKTINFITDYAGFAQGAFEEILSYLEELGVFPLSGPIVCFHNMNLEKLDVEAGWQIAEQVQNKEDIRCTRTPSRKVATAIDLGPYEKQDPTLMDILEWIKTNGLEPQGPIYYCYLNDTGRPEEEFLTQMSLPIK